MNCDDVKQALFDFVDGELTKEHGKLFHEHVALCENCRRAVAFETQFKARVAQSLTSRPVPAALSEKLSQKLLEEHTCPRDIFSRLSSSPALSFALAACLSFFVALSMFRPSSSPVTLSQMAHTLHLPKDVHTHFLACKNCQDEIMKFVLAHENGESDPHPHAKNFKDALLHLQKCTPCREHTIDLLRAHMHEET